MLVEMLAGCETKYLELVHLSHVNQQYCFMVFAFFHFSISNCDAWTEENLVEKDKRLHLVGKNFLFKEKKKKAGFSLHFMHEEILLQILFH